MSNKKTNDEPTLLDVSIRPENKEKPLDSKVIDEKIGDLINYAVLLEGLWKR